VILHIKEAEVPHSMWEVKKSLQLMLAVPAAVGKEALAGMSDGDRGA